MHIVKSVGVLSVAKIMGMIYGCMGLIFAPFLLMFGAIGAFAGQSNIPFAGIFSVVGAIVMPLLYGAFGFIGGAIGALLYNLFAKWVGGLELELQVTPATLTAPYPIIPPASGGTPA
jgi:hypothetical protein